MKYCKKRMTGIALVSAVIFFSFSTGIKAQKPGTAKHEGKICDVTSFSMNKICREWDGQWEGITVASDGKTIDILMTMPTGGKVYTRKGVKRNQMIIISD
ncbi:MAG: hypothetical protein KAT31_04415 [Bacteroidales bacterium]|nr:hypothetical protein [Bacteroidales bacterium]